MDIIQQLNISEMDTQGTTFRPPNIKNLFSFIKKYHPKGIKELDVFVSTFLTGYKGRWLGGGAIRRAILDGNCSSDWDMFFDSQETLDSFVEQCQSYSVENLKENDHNISFTITLPIKKDDSEEPVKFDIQAIKVSYYIDPEDVIDTFDYTICQFITDGEGLWTGESSLFDLSRKKLVVNRITFPVASLRRLLKYTNQGFYACSGCLQSLLKAVADDPDLLNQKIKYID